MVAVFFLVGGLILLGAYIGLLRGVTKDAERRGENGCLVALFVNHDFPINFFLWNRYRPETLARDREDDKHPSLPGASINDFVDDDEEEAKKNRHLR